MIKGLTIAFLVAAALGVIGYMMMSSPGGGPSEILLEPPHETPERAPARDGSETEKETSASAPIDKSPLSVAEREVVSARVELEHATDVFTTAEHEFDDLEREVDAVERYVEDLEELGEDPARHAEEGMRRLNPIIEQYEARLIILEDAEASVFEARMALKAAESALERLRE